MRGPVDNADVPAERGDSAASAGDLEITESRRSLVGATTVRRALPQRVRRTVGAWCFVDHMGPAEVDDEHAFGIGPHPHIGLQAVTWLLAGEALHRDSLGSEQLIRPGQLNLMTAGRGVAHAEEGTGYRGEQHGVQLWVAQPSATREGDPAFEHHAELPQVELGSSTATVLVGEFGGAASPAQRDTDHLGADLDLRAGTTVLPLRPEHEHALVVLDGGLEVGGRRLEPGHLAYLGLGRDECSLVVAEPARVLVVGGVPFPEPVLMWWNYVARERDEITAAHRQWTERTERFGHVTSTLDRIDVAPPPWASSP